MDYYKLIGLDPTCTDDEIKERCRYLTDAYAAIRRTWP
jgi:curved DNA-binding protein CbpA